MLVYKTNFIINLIELKIRSFYFFYTLFLTFLVCFYYKIELFFLISNFFLQYEKGFIYTSLLDPILIYLKLSILFSFIFTLPVFIYLYGFFFIKSFYTFYLNYFIFYSFLMYIISFILFLALSTLLLPVLLDFLIGFQRNGETVSYVLTLQATITQYYSFFFSYIYFYLILIIIPNIYLLLIFFNILNRKNFLNHSFRKYLYLIAIFIFLIFAPPDF